MLQITFLSDYGSDDEWVGVCHGVIQRTAPGALVIDVAHGLPPHDISTAALVLRDCLAFLPPGVHLAVVDPGVGSDRRAVALRCGERLLVGPDNGLLWPAAAASGGVEQSVDLSDSPHRLEPISATFHGRDLFAPVAARLALGDSLEQVGRPFPPAELVRLELPRPSVATGRVATTMLRRDRFGNVQLALDAADMQAAGFAPGDRLELRLGEQRVPLLFARTFDDAVDGELIAYEDSSGRIALARRCRSAAELVRFDRGAPAEIVSASTP